MSPRPSNEDVGEINSKLDEILSKYHIKLNPKPCNKASIFQEPAKPS
jgi:hypothetical protein